MFAHEDKFIHFIMYAGLTFLGIMANAKEMQLKYSLVSILLVATSIGILTELIQSVLPSRTMSGVDLLANTIGVFGGYLVSRIIKPS